jgi:amino acid transporter
MKTPIGTVVTAVLMWVIVYAITMVPMYTKNYWANLSLMTIVIPNILRLIVGQVPQLAVDRGFFFSSTIIAFITIEMMTRAIKSLKEQIKNYGQDRKKSLQISLLFLTAFIFGTIVTYMLGVDNSIYSNMGWEQ